MRKINLTLVIPCYNEGVGFAANVEKVMGVLDGTNYVWELILIDDFSQDSTREKINEIIKNNPEKKIKKIFHAKNEGRGQTVNDGIMEASGTIVGFIDIDLEVGPWYIPPLVRKIENGADLSYGDRIYKFHLSSLDRYLASRTYNYLVRKLLNIPFYDTEAGYKFFNREKIIVIMKKMKDKRWFWDTEIMAISFSEGLKIASIPVLFVRRREKKSTVKLFSDSIGYLKNILRYRKEHLKRKTNR